MSGLEAAGGILFALHLAATLYMAGVIWFVQLVHYPQMDEIPAETFAAFEQRNVAATGRVVGLPMLVEAGTGLALLVQQRPFGDQTLLFAASLGLLALVWISTAVWQVPAHNRLGSGFDATAHRRLVKTNWVRTAAWSARALLLLLLIPPPQ